MSETKTITTTDKDRIEPHDGLVAFYDILGYSSIAHAGIGINIRQIFQILGEVKHQTKESIRKFDLKFMYHDEEEGGKDDAEILRFIDNILAKIDTDNISDSLVTTMPLIIQDEWHLRVATLIFVAYCVRLNTLLFKNGLPIRGSIEKGTFFKQNQILAGTPLINAYKLSENLLFAGVTLTLSTESWIKSIDPENVIFTLFTGRLQVPTKKGKYTLVCLKHSDLQNKGDKQTDIRDFVFRNFSAFGKETSIDVLEKLENTIAFLSTKSINS